jgi:hypothetical protein
MNLARASESVRTQCKIETLHHCLGQAGPRLPHSHTRHVVRNNYGIESGFLGYNRDAANF